MTESAPLNDRLTDAMTIPLEAVINRQQPRPQEQEPPWTKWVLLSMTTIVFAGSLVWAFFSERPDYLDDLALFSAAYTYAHGGVVTYPVQGEFHSMVVQPPLLYWMLGFLLKSGLPAYYAEAIPPLFFLLLCLFFVWSSRFSVLVRVGLLLVF